MNVQLAMGARRLTEAVRASIVARVRFGLERFADQIDSVSVSLGPVSGPGGTTEIESRILVRAGDLEVREQAVRRDELAAVGVALDRAERALSVGLQCDIELPPRMTRLRGPGNGRL